MTHARCCCGCLRVADVELGAGVLAASDSFDEEFDDQFARSERSAFLNLPALRFRVRRSEGGNVFELEGVPCFSDQITGFMTTDVAANFGGGDIIERTEWRAQRLDQIRIVVDVQGGCLLELVELVVGGEIRIRSGSGDWGEWEPLDLSWVLYYDGFEDNDRKVPGSWEDQISRRPAQTPPRKVAVLGGHSLSVGPPDVYWCDPANFPYAGVSVRSDGNGLGLTITRAFGADDPCVHDPIFYATPCDGVGAPITVDIRDALNGLVSSPELGGVRYRPTGSRSIESVDTTLWTPGLCDRPDDPDPEHPIMQQCGGLERIVADSTTREAGDITAIRAGVRYFDTGELSTDEPLAVEWSSEDCPNAQEEVYEICAGGFTPLLFRRVRIKTPDSWEFVRVSGGVLPGDCETVRAFTAYFRRINSADPDVQDITDIPGILISSIVQVAQCAPSRIAPCPRSGDDGFDGPLNPGLGRRASRMSDTLTSRPTYPIDPSFDPEYERRELRNGGRCGCSPPSSGG